MNRGVSTATLALLLALAGPISAQMQMRVDRSTEPSDPDDTPEVTFAQVGSGFQIGTGPAVVAWDPAHTASGTYTLKAKFTLLEPSGHTNYYGLVFGGSDIASAAQHYIYFLVAQNGTYLVKYRMGEEVGDIKARGPNDAVVKPGADGKSVNDLEVRVGASSIDFVVNGTVVHTQPKAGMAAATDGIYGVRVNHVMPAVLIEGLSVSH